MKKIAIIGTMAILLVFSAHGQRSRAESLFTGNGGRGISLAILVPEASGIPAEQNYLPTLIQGVLVSDLSRFSAITVLDRVRLESVLRETESGIYRSEADFGRLGEITETDYALMGTITRTGAGYAMQIQVVGTGRNTIGQTRASYSGNFTIAELDNFTGIRRASMELLSQMGVNLTAAARAELSGAENSARVHAQTAVAQGIVAQRGGNTAETFVRFSEAAALDSSFTEAAVRANAVSATIRTGRFGDDLRNDLAWRGEWEALIRNTIGYLQNSHIVVAEITYNPSRIRRVVNYQRGTVEFTFDLVFNVAQVPQEYIRILRDLQSGLNATRRNRDWGLSVPNDIHDALHPVGISIAQGGHRISYTAEIVDNKGAVISQRIYRTWRDEEEAREGIRFSIIGEQYYRSNRDNFSGPRPPGIFFYRTSDFRTITLSRRITRSVTLSVPAANISDEMPVRIRATVRGRVVNSQGVVPDSDLENWLVNVRTR